MTQGIRSFVNASFIAHLANIAELGNAGFRKAVREDAIAQFNITEASASTHYNHSLKQARLNDPKSVAGLGRPDDKKGGAPVKHAVTVIKVKTGEVVATGISKAAAELLITTAVTKRKAKLAIKVDEVAEAATA